MTSEEYELFTTKGHFTIRRSNKFWSGIWTDMTIKQTLMKTMKSIGGLTHGRGIKDSVLTMWTLGMIFLQNVCEEIEKYCDVSFTTSEQHIEMRNSRINRDNDDVKKLLDWFSQHPSFPEMKEIMSISTGIIGNEKINCHMSQELGIASILKIIDCDFDTVKFRRKDKVTPLAVINTGIRIEEDIIPINPLLIFQRMCIAKQSEEEIEEYLTYELAPFPLSLFDEVGMRKCIKSSLYKMFTPCSDNIYFGNSIYIIDGGYLLHKVVWHRNESFASICTNYIQYVRLHYENAVIVFDGYPEDAANRSTKCTERLQRSRKNFSADVLFDDTMVPTVSQEKFLANERNKNRFISMLKVKFEAANFIVKQAVEDADTLIINTAIDMSSAFDSVIVIGEDVDLLVLLTALASTHLNLYFLKPGKGKIMQQLYSIQRLQAEKAIAENILFLHAFSGCDTTSAFFNQGKIKFLNILKKIHI